MNAQNGPGAIEAPRDRQTHGHTSPCPDCYAVTILDDPQSALEIAHEVGCAEGREVALWAS